MGGSASDVDIDSIERSIINSLDNQYIHVGNTIQNAIRHSQQAQPIDRMVDCFVVRYQNPSLTYSLLNKVACKRMAFRSADCIRSIS